MVDWRGCPPEDIVVDGEKLYQRPRRSQPATSPFSASDLAVLSQRPPRSQPATSPYSASDLVVRFCHSGFLIEVFLVSFNAKSSSNVTENLLRRELAKEVRRLFCPHLFNMKRLGRNLGLLSPAAGFRSREFLRPPDSGHRIFPDRRIPVTGFSPVTSY
ncbi:hypothetical protein ACLB2K_006487 [Fragaria x ananassa]